MDHVHHKENSSSAGKKLDPHVASSVEAQKAIAKASHTSRPENRESYELSLPPELQKLLTKAKARYNEYMEVAQKFDDSQERFTSQAENLLKASELLARIALRSKQIGEVA